MGSKNQIGGNLYRGLLPTFIGSNLLSQMIHLGIAYLVHLFSSLLFHLIRDNHNNQCAIETNYEEQIPVDADHSAMCKFETDQNDTFEKVYKRIQRMRNNPRRVAGELSGRSS